MNLRSRQWLWSLGLISWLAANPATANCAGTPASLEWYEPVMTEHFQQLQSQSTYPWGEARVFDQIVGDRVLLTEAFETLNGPQKVQVLSTLIGVDFQAYLTPEEYEQKLNEPGIGPSPYDVVASDGRLVSAVYDGCTRDLLLTEQARFSWHYNSQGLDVPRSELRNAGQPSWRQVNFAIAPEDELAVRLGFWESVGYENFDWWIAWVPEHGYFEVNVPENFDEARLQRYWQVADRNYRYVVVRADGTELGEKQF
ncbi:MAG: phosphoribosylaminoimidazolesuccinocarboxamide synthase [Cyanobacteria bacterium P01_E01_bin.43]